MICRVTCTQPPTCAPPSAPHAEQKKDNPPRRGTRGEREKEGEMASVELIMRVHSPSGRVSRHAGKGLCFLFRETKSIATRGSCRHSCNLVIHLFGPPAVRDRGVWGWGFWCQVEHIRSASARITQRKKGKRTSTSSVSSSSGPPSPSSSSLSPVAFSPSPPWAGARSARFVGTGAGSGCSGRTLSFPETFVERRGFVSSGTPR